MFSILTLISLFINITKILVVYLFFIQIKYKRVYNNQIMHTAQCITNYKSLHNISMCINTTDLMEILTYIYRYLYVGVDCRSRSQQFTHNAIYFTIINKFSFHLRYLKTKHNIYYIYNLLFLMTYSGHLKMSQRILHSVALPPITFM